MPITAAFTVTAGAALLVHLLYVGRTYLNRQAQYHSKTNGDRRRIADSFFFMELTRFGLNACLFLAGLGLLFHVRSAGYLLAAPPLLSLISSSIALRGIR